MASTAVGTLVTIIVTSWLFLASPLYLGGYYYRYYLNQNDLIQTECTVTNHTIVPIYSCDRRDCSKYKLNYTIEYLVTEEKPTLYNTTILYDKTMKDEMTARSILKVNEPIGRKYTCYYSKSDPYEVQEEQYDQNGYLIAAIFFTSIGLAACLLLIGVLLRPYCICLLEKHRKWRAKRHAAAEAARDAAEAARVAARAAAEVETRMKELHDGLGKTSEYSYNDNLNQQCPSIHPPDYASIV